MKTCYGGRACPMNVAPPPPIEVLSKHLATAHNQEPTVSKQSKVQKAAARVIRKGLAKSVARKSLAGAIAADENRVMKRIRQLEQQVAKSAGQDSWAAAYPLAKARMELLALQQVRKAAMPSPDSFSSYETYMSDPNANARAGAAASRAATQRAVGSVTQGDAINQHLGGGPRAAIQDIINDSGQSESLQTFEVQTRKLEKQLADAQTPSERESLGYQVTRRRLLAMHVRGEG